MQFLQFKAMEACNLPCRIRLLNLPFVWLPGTLDHVDPREFVEMKPRYSPIAINALTKYGRLSKLIPGDQLKLSRDFLDSHLTPVQTISVIPLRERDPCARTKTPKSPTIVPLLGGFST